MNSSQSSNKPLIKSVVVLTLICLITTAVLAVVNYYTAPVIEHNQEEVEHDTLILVMPNGSGFSALSADQIPEGSTVKTVYRETTGKGYVFSMEVAGYQPGLQIMCGIGEDGAITGVRTVACNDTAGYGQRVTEEWYTEQYTGQRGDLSGVNAVSGATITSNAYRRAVLDAFSLFETLTGSEN